MAFQLGTRPRVELARCGGSLHLENSTYHQQPPTRHEEVDVAYVRTRPEGSRTLLFENRRLVRVLKISKVEPRAILVEAYDPDESPVFTLEAWQGNPIVVWSQTQLAFYRLTRGRTPHAKIGFSAPLSIIILEEERCRNHVLPDGYIVRPLPTVRGRFRRRASR